jgi:AcrR family transcriptional regulator
VSDPRGEGDLHDEAVAELCRRVRGAYVGPPAWHDRIWAAGWAAMRYLEEDPVRARLLVAAAGGGGSGSLGRRNRIVQGLAELLDGGRGEAERHGATTHCTAEILAGAVYGTLLAKIAAGSIERGEEFLPELVHMAVMPYLGSRAAEEELEVQPLR